MRCYTSTDGVNWTESPQSPIRACTNGVHFSVFFDGTYFHYAWGNSNTSTMYYRMGTPNSDGSITWAAAEDDCGTGVYPYITVDSDGYPFIGYRSGVNYPWCNRSTTKDGTWTTDTANGFPYQLSTNNYDSVMPVALTGGKAYVFYAYYNITIKGKLFTPPNTWSSEETCNSYGLDTANVFSGFSAVAVNDVIHLLYKRMTTYEVRYNKRDGSWGTDTLIQSVVDYTGVTLSKDGTTLYAFWTHSPTHDHIYYKKCVNGTWDTNPTDWLTDTNISHLSGFSSWQQSFSDKLGIAWVAGTASPYNVRFDFLTLVTVVEKAFSDTGLGSEAFLNPFRAMGFGEVGAGSEVFGIPFKALPFSDVGQGADVFNTPFRAMGFSDVGSGLDSFIVLLSKAFADAGLGSDVFAKELIGFLEKAFADVGLGTDAFLIPFKSMKFSDFALGSDVFTIPFKAIIFVDTGTGADMFVIPFKTMSFSDVASGTDIFFLLQEKAFSDVGDGADAFSKTILELISKAFADAGLGSDVFSAKHIHKVKLPFLIGLTLDGKLVIMFKQEFDAE